MGAVLLCIEQWLCMCPVFSRYCMGYGMVSKAHILIVFAGGIAGRSHSLLYDMVAIGAVQRCMWPSFRSPCDKHVDVFQQYFQLQLACQHPSGVASYMVVWILPIGTC